MSIGTPLLSLSLACLVAAATATFALAEPFALLASARGTVEVTAARGGAPLKATFGRPLERGDKVSVGPGGSATVYFSDGNVIELSERSAVTVGGRVANRAAAGPGALPGNVYAQVTKVMAGGSRETGLVATSQLRGGEAAQPVLLAPRNSEILGGRPSLSWRAVTGAKRYRVSVSNLEGELWNREVATPSLAWPADAAALAGDADYSWKVEVFDDLRSLRSEETGFHVVSDEAAGAWRADVQRISESAGGDEHPATLFLSGSYLLGRGALHEAVARFARLVQIEPTAPAPHEALGNAYRAMGLMDQAAAEFEKALALTKSNP